MEGGSDGGRVVVRKQAVADLLRKAHREQPVAVGDGQDRIQAECVASRPSKDRVHSPSTPDPQTQSSIPGQDPSRVLFWNGSPTRIRSARVAFRDRTS